MLDPTQRRDLLLRAKQVLGSEAAQTLASSRPRLETFSQAMLKAVEAMGSPEAVTDEHILGAMQIAHELFPVELETLSQMSSPQTSGQSTP